MERKIGEIFEHKGEWYQCVENTIGACWNCDLRIPGCRAAGACSHTIRNDKKNVCFKKLEKIGKPFIARQFKYPPNGWFIDRYVVQKYKLYNNYSFYNNSKPYIFKIHGKPGIVYIEIDKEKEIEIKQNQEDMEEKKPILKEFDLEAAKAGKPVCTRDGRKARIICFDYKGATNDYPIVALMEYNNDKGDVFEKVEKYTNEGNYNKYGGNKHPNDLMMLPEKHEGWVNICKNADDDYFVKGIFRSEKFARNNGVNYPGLIIATVKISWEE